MPKEGVWEWTHCFGGPVHTIIATPEFTAGTYVVTGVSRSAGPVETMSLECNGTFEYRGGKARSQGSASSGRAALSIDSCAGSHGPHRQDINGRESSW